LFELDEFTPFQGNPRMSTPAASGDDTLIEASLRVNRSGANPSIPEVPHRPCRPSTHHQHRSGMKPRLRLSFPAFFSCKLIAIKPG